jgi:hypothetical protein
LLTIFSKTTIIIVVNIMNGSAAASDIISDSTMVFDHHYGFMYPGYGYFIFKPVAAHV